MLLEGGKYGGIRCYRYSCRSFGRLCENKSLETLFIYHKDARLEDYLVFVAAIQPNATLKSLRLHHSNAEDETKDLIAVLKKNYGLEEIPGLNHGKGDIRSIFDLNRAGRRCLVQDGSSISKGVDVLSRLNDDINSVFLHLLENPRLCDRKAVERASIGNMDNAKMTSPPGNRHSGGKQRESQVPHNVVQGPARTPFSDKSDFSVNTGPVAGKGSSKSSNATAANKRESAASLGKEKDKTRLTDRPSSVASERIQFAATAATLEETNETIARVQICFTGIL
jgi:hypothetical protein